MEKLTNNTKCPITGLNICSKEKCLAWNRETKSCVFIQGSPQGLECLKRVIGNEIGVYNLHRIRRLKGEK